MKQMLFLCLLIMCLQRSKSQDLISQSKKIVAFVLVKQADGQITPYGTGFFVGKQIDSIRELIFFVTARHVLQDNGHHKFLQSIFLRYNLTNGTSEISEVPLILNGANKNVFLSSDSSVDVAAIPLFGDFSKIDFLIPEVNSLITKRDFDRYGIHEGTEVFFTGLFTSYIGIKQNHPIFRFGRIALLTDERVYFVDTTRDIFLVESTCFGGNSGSPLFFSFEKGGYNYSKLAGLVTGNFNEKEGIVTATSDSLKSINNLGISAITPADYIINLINSEELKGKFHYK